MQETGPWTPPAADWLASSWMGQLVFTVRRVVQRPSTVLRLLPLCVVPSVFAAFVVVNGGVVVGDRSAHAPALHPMQLCYCAAWLVMSMGPLLATTPRCVELMVAVHACL